MEDQLAKQDQFKLKRFFTRKVKIRIAYITLIILVLFGALLKGTVYYEKLYKGISINGVYVGGSTLEEAKIILSDYYKKLDDVVVRVVCGDEKITLKGADISAKFNVDKSIEMAYNHGKEGNIFERIGNGVKYQFSDENIIYNIDYERLAFDSKIDKLINAVGREVVQPTYSKIDNKLYITTGVTGTKIDEEDLVAQIVEKFNKAEDAFVGYKAIEVKPSELKISKIYDEIKTEVKDATYINNSGAFEVISEVVGVDFDLENAEKIASAVKEEGVQFTIDLIITLPQVTTEQILKDLFKEELASFTSYYKVSEVQRTENVRLSASLINGTILMPGQEFSYNNIVGERSIERGFQIAKVYQSGKVVDGLGGGICQTSSTLYNAVLEADLEVTSRKNHSLPVSYVKLGRDATVVYGVTDFKFKNNQKTPIKIEAEAKGGVLTVKIMGFEKNKDKEVSLITETVKVRPFTETIIEDTTIPVGSTQIITKGSNGYVVKTYKVIKENGVESEPKLISTDTYAPIVQVKKIGVEPTLEGL